jgi:hypothetical protein
MGEDPGAPLWQLAIHWEEKLGRWVQLRKLTLLSPYLWLTSVQWTLANVFDVQGWLFPKLDLAVALLHWTIYFIFDQDIEGCGPGKKGVDYYLELRKRLGADEKTKKVYNISPQSSVSISIILL